MGNKKPSESLRILQTELTRTAAEVAKEAASNLGKETVGDGEDGYNRREEKELRGGSRSTDPLFAMNF
eukprot:5779196-Pleurochrysis_carterae.AAC.1